MEVKAFFVLNEKPHMLKRQAESRGSFNFNSQVLESTLLLSSQNSREVKITFKN